MQFRDELTSLPKAGSEADVSTRLRVARTILENGPSTAAALGEALGLTPAAVRRHLDHLLAAGWVEAKAQRVYGTRSRGRPARTFGLTEAGHDHFDQAYDDLATQALRFLAERGGDEAVVDFARQRMAFIEREYESVSQAHPELTATEALARVLSEDGYVATVKSLPVGDQLCQQHCPVSHVAAEFPQLCDAETEAFSRVLGTHVQRLATIAHGDGVCTTHVPSAVKSAQAKENR